MNTTRFMTALALCAATLTTTGCLLGGEGGPNTPGWEVEENDPAPDLEAIFLSGHLGGYADCPDEGYTEAGGASSDEDSRGAPGAGDCAPPEPGEDSGGCGGFWGCEGAQFTLKLVNNGEAKAVGISFESIGLLGDDGDVAAILPFIGMTDAMSGGDFDGELEVGEEVTLRVEFLGPEDISEFVPSQNRWSGGAALEITVGADNLTTS